MNLVIKLGNHGYFMLIKKTADAEWHILFLASTYKITYMYI